MNAILVREPQPAGSGDCPEGKSLLLQKVHHCRGWLAILRAVGRHNLFYEYQQILGDLDTEMAEVLNAAIESQSISFSSLGFSESMEMADLVLLIVKQCLEDLKRGPGLSKESRSRLSELRSSTGLIFQQGWIDPES